MSIATLPESIYSDHNNTLHADEDPVGLLQCAVIGAVFGDNLDATAGTSHHSKNTVGIIPPVRISPINQRHYIHYQ